MTPTDHRQQHRDRDVPALVERDQEQKGEQDREREHHRGLAGGLLLLEGRAGPLVAVAGRQDPGREPLHGGERIAGAVAGRGRAVDRDAPVEVVADQRRGPEHQAHRGERADRHHLALGVPHVHLEDVVDLAAEVLVGLDVDLPGAAEQVEVVDVEAAERALQRGEHVVDVDAQRLRLVAVEIEVELRRVGGEGAEHARQLGLLVGLDDHRAHHLGELGDVAARPDPGADTRSRRCCRGR